MRARQLWGNEIYTQDSDLVAVIMHLGYYNHSIASPPPGALEVRSTFLLQSRFNLWLTRNITQPIVGA